MISYNVYDFDDTIMKGDSTARFVRYCFAHYPKLWTDAPGQLLNAVLFLLRIRKKQDFKQRLFALVTHIDNTTAAVEKFWDRNSCHIKAFYAETHRDDDIVISASPEFLIKPICKRLGISNVMASPVDPETGHYHGLNCHGEEKVRRFRERFGNAGITCFYSDSHSDDPLARLAEHAYMVKGDTITPWEFK